MIYINEDSEYILIPKIVEGIPVCLYLSNQLTHKKISLDVTDLTPTKTFYKFELEDLTEFTDGQYDFSVLDENDEVLATGILQFGDFDTETNQYENNNTTVTYEG